MPYFFFLSTAATPPPPPPPPPLALNESATSAPSQPDTHDLLRHDVIGIARLSHVSKEVGSSIVL